MKRTHYTKVVHVTCHSLREVRRIIRIHCARDLGWHVHPGLRVGGDDQLESVHEAETESWVDAEAGSILEPSTLSL